MAKMSNESKETLDLISEDFVVNASSDKSFYHKRSGDQLNEKGFKHYCAKHYGSVVLETEDKDGNLAEKRMNAGEVWGNPDFTIESRQVVRRIVMVPTEQPESEGDPEQYNRWYILKEEMVPPAQATADDITPFLHHLMYISGGDVVGVTFFLNWLATLYRFPDLKLPTAVLLYSKFGGVGKTMLWKLLKEVFGRSMVGSCTGTNLNKSFDDVTEHKRILFVNEMAKSDRADGYERFKNMISEEQVSFEGKGKAARDIFNVTHYIITTNNSDALPLMEKDRRVACLRCEEDPKPQAYYAQLHQWIEGPGPALLAGVLANWKFAADWNPHAPVPQTEAARIMQAESRSHLVGLIEELIEEGRAPFDRDLGRPLDLCMQLEALYGTTLKGTRLNNRSVPQALERVGAENWVVIYDKDGKRTTARIWCWRNVEQWQNMSGNEVAKLLSL